MRRWLPIAIAAVALLGWFFRWEVVTVPTAYPESPPHFYLVNRWTGEIRVVNGHGHLPVERMD